MSVDYTTQTEHNPPHHVTVTAGADADTLTFTIQDDYDFAPYGPPQDPRRLGNVMLSIDGVLVVQTDDWNATPPFRGHAVAQTDGPGNRRTVSFTVRRDLFHIPPGLHVLTVGVWQTDNQPVGYYDISVDVPSRPVRSLMPGKILRTLFHSDPLETRDPVPMADLTAAGVNCLSFGVFYNPGDHPEHDTIEDWRVWSLDGFLRPRLAATAAAGKKMLAIGDSFVRNAAEQAWLLSCPWSAQAVAETAIELRDSGLCVGVSVLDESPETLSTNPAYVKFRDSWNAVAGAPPLSWPNIAHNDESESPAWSGFNIRFWTTGLQWRPSRRDGFSLNEFRESVSGAVAELDATRPAVCQLSVNGPHYTKLTAGGNYQPGADLLQSPGLRSLDIVACTWIALTGPICGFDAYALDTFWVEQRATSPIGTADLQTGARPGDPRWPGVVAAFQSVAAREGLLTSGHVYPAQVANGWVMGRRGQLAWYVNTLEIPQECSVPGVLLTPAGEVSFAGGMVPPGGVVLSE